MGLGGIVVTNVNCLEASKGSCPHRSPFRYPGGKSNALRKIVPIILEQGPNQLVSPFLGGGSIEIAVADRGIKVLGFDSFELLVNCWDHVLGNPDRLAKAVGAVFPVSRERFRYMQKHIDTATQFEQAVWFFVLNRVSRNGLTLSGGFSGDRFTRASIDKLRKFEAPSLVVGRQDFRETLERYPDDLLYLDPPYYNCPNLYGVRGSHSKNFPHVELAKRLLCRSKWILSYNDTRKIRELYSGCRFFFPTWPYGMKDGKEGQETIIVSGDIRIPDGYRELICKEDCNFNSAELN